MRIQVNSLEYQALHSIVQEVEAAKARLDGLTKRQEAITRAFLQSHGFLEDEWVDISTIHLGYVTISKDNPHGSRDNL